MRLALSRRTTLVLAAVIAVGALLELLAGGPVATSSQADVVPKSQRQQKHLELTSPQPGRTNLSAGAAQLLLALAHRTTDASQANALFPSQSWYVAPPPPPPQPVQEVAPSAPPFPYSYVGSYSDGSGSPVYFLTRDDRVYDVRPGDTLDQIYSVDAVDNGQLVFTYKPLNIRQTLAMGVAP